MTAYGQSITPRWFQDQTAKAMTKMGFAQYAHRALMQVGMLPIRSWNPFDLELPEFTEHNPGSTRGDYNWYYDYPASETWTLEGIAYRPVLCMTVHVQTSGTLTVGHAQNLIRFEHMYRRADRFNLDDACNLGRLHTATNNYGLGNVSEHVSIGNADGYAEQCGLGAYHQLNTWKVFAASADVLRQDTLAVFNFHVILGKGGLTMMVGSGTSKLEANNIIAFTVAFGGARIPGRARIPASDPNLDLINPTFMLPHHVASLSGATPLYWIGNTVYDDVTLTGAHPVSFALGMQFGLKIARGTQSGFTTRPGAVRLDFYNLENIERPLFPSARGPTLNSPREHISGAAHVLQPIVYTPVSRRTLDTDYYQVQDFNIRTQIAPTWFDIFFVPKLRFGDATAPYGEYVDPVTSLNWFLFHYSGLSMMLATEVEGITKHASYTIPAAFSTVTDDYYNLNAGFTWAGPSPHPAVASIIQASSVSQAWTPTAATDEATLITASNGSSQLQLLVDPLVGMTVDTAFTLRFELYWRSVSAQTNATSNAFTLDWSSDGGTTWHTVLVVWNTGVTAGPYQTYTQTPEVIIRPGFTTGRLRLRFNCQLTSNTGGNRTCGIRNIRLKRTIRA